MRLTRTRNAIAVGAAGLGVLLGAAGISAAVTNPGPSSGASSDHRAAETDDEAVSYRSSVTASDGAALDGLATVTPEQAAAAAASAANGTAGEVELENDDGNVVYDVEVTRPDGTKLEVKVDAGNATVLAQEADDDAGESSEADDESESESESELATEQADQAK